MAQTVGKPWVYPDIDGVLTDIITFKVCECDCDCDCDENDCCSYYVAAITSAVTEGVGTTATLAFNNPTLAALVVDNTKRS